MILPRLGGAWGLIPDIGIIEWLLREGKGSRYDVDDNRFGGSCIAMQGTVRVAYALIIEQHTSLWPRYFRARAAETAGMRSK